MKIASAPPQRPPPATPATASTPENNDAAGGSGPAQRDLIAGLEKGLAVIEAFDQDQSRLNITEVAARCGLTRAAARRYLLTLAHLGYVRQDGRLFALTPKVLRLGQSYLHSARLPRIIAPQLHRLAFALHEATSAAILDGNDAICIAAASAGQVVSATLQPGTRVPAWCTANGRVLLASLAQDQVDAWLARQAFEALTPFTIVNAERLRIEIARTRAAGYATVDQELELGLRTIAVPLKNFAGQTVAAMNVTSHSSRLRMDELRERCLPALLQAQAQLAGVL